MATFHSPQVILISDDLPGAVAFYQGVGFEQTFRTPAEGEPIHVDRALDGYKIGIASKRMVARSPPPTTRPGPSTRSREASTTGDISISATSY